MSCWWPGWEMGHLSVRLSLDSERVEGGWVGGKVTEESIRKLVRQRRRCHRHS